MTKLSPTARASLDALQEKHLAFTIAKATIEREMKREIAERLAAIKHERDMALRLAADSGVPKSQLGKAIGTTNFRTVQEILDATDNVLQPSQSQNAGNGTVAVEPTIDDTFFIYASNLGETNISGKVRVAYHPESEELEFIEGDAFVIPQLYRNNLADRAITEIRRFTNG